MLGLLGGLGKGALESKYEQKLLQRKLLEEWQKKYTEQQLKANELLPEEKTYISSVPRYRRLMKLAHEKLNVAKNALPNPRFSRFPMGGKLRSLTDLTTSKEKMSARGEFARFLEGEFLPTVMQIEGLPMTEYSVKSFKEKFDINKLKAKDWKKFFNETSAKLEARAGDIQQKIGRLNETQLGGLMQDPQIQATVKEEIAEKLDSKIKGLSDDELNSLVKLIGNAELVDEPPEIKKNLLRELGLQFLFDLALVGEFATVGGLIAGPIGMVVFGAAGYLTANFAGSAVERMIAGDPDALSNAYTENKEDLALNLASYATGGLISKGVKAARGLFKQGREPVRNVVSRGFDTAIKNVPDIKVKDVGEYLGSVFKKTSDPFEQKVIKGLESEFSGKSGSYTAEKFADMLSKRRISAEELGKKYGATGNEVRDIVSKLEERFLPLRADVSKTMGLLSGASSALEKGNVRKVAEIFSELPEKIAIDNGVFTKDQVIRGFLLENANTIRNKFRKPIASEGLMEFANKTGWFDSLSASVKREALARIGLDGITDPKIAKLFAQYAFGSSKDPVTRELMAALQGKIIEEQSGFIMETLKKTAMSGVRGGLRGWVKWEEYDD